jgi:hypothetical protein
MRGFFFIQYLPPLNGQLKIILLNKATAGMARAGKPGYKGGWKKLNPVH